jgi:ABC-type bacteriocin/lantibiotic exporter with double-glycine peptidase domain
MSRQTNRVVSFVLLATGLFAGGQMVLAGETFRITVPFHRQQKNGCGPASVEMLESYWSAQQPEIVPATRTTLRTRLTASQDQGALLSDMRDYLISNGYHAFTFQASSADLKEQLSKGRVPIVALKSNRKSDLHYVVVTGIDEHQMWLNDPAKRKPGHVDRAKFLDSWIRAGGWMLLAVPSKGNLE